MAWLRRGAKAEADQGIDTETVEEEMSTDNAESAESASSEEPMAAILEGGPKDITEVDERGDRLDLGAIWLPRLEGAQVRLDLEGEGQARRIVSVTITSGASTLQLQAFAAPRTAGIWDEIREEISESVTKQGGSADDIVGPFGRELLARIPSRTSDGRTGHRPARFLGVDGPRWFLRGVITGQAVVEEKAAKPLEDLFSGIVVSRGTEARPPRELLTLTTPRAPGSDVSEDEAAGSAPSFDPLKRGPEITEIR